MKIFAIVTGCALVIASTPALAVDCNQVMKHMAEMRKAQQALLTSLAENHETVAAAIEDVTSQIDEHDGRIPDRAINAINKTARTFRTRGVTAKRQAQRMDEATADLMSEVSACLKR